MSLAGKCALITGSSRGIGRGIAFKLAEQGAKIAVHYYQNEAAAKATLAKIRERGSDGFVVQGDVCHHEEVSRIFQQFLVGVREAARLMPDHGRVVAITYAPGGKYGSWQPWVAMGAAKAGLEVLCRYFAVALASRGITVNALSPGWIEDSVLNSLPEAVQNSVRNWHQGGWTPMGRLGTPADVGNAVALLCSEEASWITGQLIDVDGGASLMNAHLPLDIQQSAPRREEAA